VEHDDPRLRWHWLHGVSPVTQGSRAGCALIKLTAVDREPPSGGFFVCHHAALDVMMPRCRDAVRYRSPLRAVNSQIHELSAKAATVIDVMRERWRW
jgi:hypothetical protein